MENLTVEQNLTERSLENHADGKELMNQSSS